MPTAACHGGFSSAARSLNFFTLTFFLLARQQCSQHHDTTHNENMSALSSISAARVVITTQNKGVRRGGKHSASSQHHRAPLRSNGSARTTAAVSDASASTAAAADAIETLRGVEIRRATDGETVDAASIIPAKGRVLLPFLTQFADFDSWELAQKLVRQRSGAHTYTQRRHSHEKLFLASPILFVRRVTCFFFFFFSF